MNEAAATPETAAGTIPTQQAIEIRRLSHDLSNAFEMIMQTSYLVGMLDLSPDGRQWIGMLDAAVKKAVDLNAELRVYIQQNTRGTPG